MSRAKRSHPQANQEANPQGSSGTPNLFDYQDYKRWVLDEVAKLPSNGRGELGRIARALKVHSSHLSQVLRGPRELTFEQACDLCLHFGLRPLEERYLLGLVQRARAGTPQSRSIADRMLEDCRKQAAQVQSRVGVGLRTLDEVQSARFYSSWIFSAIRLAASLGASAGNGSDGMRVADLSKRLRIPESKVKTALEFLVTQGLCTSAGGKIKMGVAHTHVAHDSPWVERHHLNWRLKAAEWISQDRVPTDLLFTAPVSISKKDLQEVRKTLLLAIERISKRVRASEPETLAILNIDWLEFP